MRNLLLLVLVGILIGLVFLSQLTFTVPPTKVFTIEDLPVGAESVKHKHEIAEAEEAEQISMKHYATAASLASGGPIFGIMGYRIVSIEYEFSAGDVPAKTVGQAFGGYVLNLPGYEHMNYDHFHISSHADGSGETLYSIHFMLIPHEEELRMGLVCE